MKNNFFARLLEIIWFVIGVISAFASINGFLRHDTKNGAIMILCSLIGFLMFFLRRSMRLRRKNENEV
jgi:uncharacterized membrane protein